MQTRRGPFGTARPLSLAALDAAITETIEKPVRRDRLARDYRVYKWICRRAIREGHLCFSTTYAEAAAGAGYDVPTLNCRANRREARHRRVSTVYRALCSLRAAGLVRFEGRKNKDGSWRCLNINILPAAFGDPPAGRSRRGPKCGPGGRVSFRPQSGTSPAVASPKGEANCNYPAFARARARAGPGTAAATSAQSARAMIRASLAEAAANFNTHETSQAQRYERYDLPDQELVEVCEAFERAFGRPAKLSLRPGSERAEQLRRILARFDRFTGAGGGFRPGHGRREVCRWLELLADHPPSVARAQSLGYFLPLFDEVSKGRRRLWKATQAEPHERTYPRQPLRGSAA